MSALITMPVLAAADTGFIVFIVIMIISWLMKLFAKAKEKEAQKPPPPRSRRTEQRKKPAEADQLQAEIDRFLKEANKSNIDVRELEPATPVVAAAPVAEPPRVARPRTSKPVELPSALRPEPMTAGRLAAPAGTERSNLEQNIRARLEPSTRDRFQRQIEEDMRANVTDSVRQHLGEFSGRVREAAPASRSTAGEIRRMFANHRSVRQAIIVNEILTRPKSRGARKSSES